MDIKPRRNSGLNTELGLPNAFWNVIYHGKQNVEINKKQPPQIVYE
jgi:hypothetical protein